ncbi:DegT/DnrJ/EryC1/StrS family aminotransferase [Colwellia sp. MEBiC06753]
MAGLRDAVTQQVANACGRDNALLTSSGSAALITALKSTNIPLGSEVIMPAICCPAVLFAIQMAGFTVVLADVSLDDFSMNVPQVEAVFTENTKAIVAVHGYGHYCQIGKLAEYCQQNNLVLVEDACLAMGGSYQGKKLGSFGDVSIMSFGYDKVLACQYGGAVLTNNPMIMASAKQFLSNNQFFNYKDCDKSLIALDKELKQLSSYVSKRREHARLCHEKLTNNNLVKPQFDDEVLFWRYPLLINGDRDNFIKKAQSNDLLLTCHYKSLQMLKTEGFLKNAQQVSDQVINIFVRPETSQTQILATIAFINENA